MKVGDPVVHKSTAINFRGKIIAEAKSSRGTQHFLVEQDETALVMNFVEHSLKPLGWFETIKEKVAPPPPPEPAPFPILYNIPERAVSRAASTHAINKFKVKMRELYLPVLPKQSLHREFVKVELEIGFDGPIIGDIDNLAKTVLDLLCRSVIVDDSQIRELAVRSMPAQGKDSIKIRITPYEPLQG